jgi:hypothetical protein
MIRTMNNVQSSCWTTDDLKIQFDFETNFHRNKSLYIVNVSLRYLAHSSNKKLVWENVDLIVGGEKFAFHEEFEFEGLYRIQGFLKASVETNNKDSNLVVWGEIQYGTHDKDGKHDELSNFIGPLWVIPHPSPPPDQSGKSNSENIVPVITPDIYHDLFPFIYLHNWPSFDPHELKFGFVVYEPLHTSPPINSFSDKLIELKENQDRDGMEKEAVKLIANNPEYENIFISHVSCLSGYISRFSWVLTKTKDLENYNYIVAYIRELLETTVDELYNYLKSRDYIVQKEKLWQSYFALIIETGYRFTWLDQVTEFLVACNFIEKLFFNITANVDQTPLTREEIKDLMYASIVLPENIFPLPPYPNSPPAENTYSWIEPYAIGNLQLVKHKLLRYEAGEIADIVSVMPGEKKITTKKKLHQETEKTEQTVFNENSQIQNFEERNDNLENEVINVLAHRKDTFTYHDYSTQYGSPTSMTINGSYDIDSVCADPAQEKALLFAKKIINATSGNIHKKVGSLRIYKVKNLQEEVSESILDNTGNHEAICGTYRWLNKIYEARLISYGNRLMLSFLIVNPSAQYIKAELSFNNEKLTEPKSPQTVFQILTLNDITVENYIQVCAYYDVEDYTLPPDEKKIISGILEGSESKFLDIPQGYEADLAYVTYISGDITDSKVRGMVGRQAFNFDGPTGVSGPLTLSKENMTVPISAACNNMYFSPPVPVASFRITIEVECICCNKAIQEWKKKTYMQIISNYKTQRSNYFNELHNKTTDNKYSNSLYDRSIIGKELKKSCIRQLINNMINISGASGKRSTGNPSCFEVNKPRFTSFLSSAIEWNEMTYHFLEDFGSKLDFANMADIMPIDENIFSAFLQAEGARIIIPVKPEYNHTILFFLKTGLIWMGKDHLVPALNDQVSLIAELKHLYDKPGLNDKILHTWEFTVPTLLQLLCNDIHLHVPN